MWTFKYLVVLPMAMAIETAVDMHEQLERDEIIEAVNRGQCTWKAGRNFDPNLKKSYLRNLLGSRKRPGGSILPPLVDDNDEDNVELPENFDARKKWPKCISLQEVRDQGPYGSCWAVGAAAAFTDRLCIASKMKINTHLSAEELMCCCDSCGDGCYGGHADAAWDFFKTNGICTGGDYHSDEGCQPYTMPACEHHIHGKRKNCSSYKLPTPPCKNVCYNKKYKDHTFAQDHHKVGSTFTISQDVQQAKKQIFQNGPLEARFDVYEDFLSYKSGVYHHATGAYHGGHGVKVIGWGVENNTPYWLVANSWNSDWGDKGFFKIKVEDNNCGFGDEMYGGFPAV